MKHLISLILFFVAFTSSNYLFAQSHVRCGGFSDTPDQTKFREAVTSDDLVLVESLLLSGRGDVNFDSRGYCAPAIFYAIENRNLPMVQLLVKYGADINFVVKDGSYETSTVLAAAVQSRSAAIVDYLIHLPGLNANAKNHEGKTAIQIAMDNFDHNLMIKEEYQIALALAKSPSVDVNTASDGYSTLQQGIQTFSNLKDSQKAAYRSAYLELVKVLIDRSNEYINFQGQYSHSALFWTLNDPEVFDLIIAHPLLKPFVTFSSSSLDYNALDASIRHGASYAFKKLLARPDLTSDVIEKVIFHRNISIADNSYQTYLQIFQDQRINPNAMNAEGQSLLEFELTETPEWSAAVSIIEDILKLPGVDVNIHNGAPLRIARENLKNCVNCTKAYKIMNLLENHGAQ